jgi:tetratricopeptide (TPR) repeat protein
LGATSGVYLRPIQGNPEELVTPLTAATWKRIGATSGVRMMITGTVRLRDGKQHVALHLIETATGSIVKTWFQDSTSFSQSARASIPNILDALSDPKEASNRPASGAGSGGATTSSARLLNSEALRYYDQGKELMFRYNLADLDRAIDSFRKAVQIDPNYAEAHAMLANACQARAQTDPAAKSLLHEAETAVEVALRLAPMLPEAHRAKAGILRRRGHLHASLDPFLTAYELDPAEQRAVSLLGDIHDQVGRPDLALGWLEKALRLQIRPFVPETIGNAWTSLGDYDQAEKAYDAAVIFRPDLPVGLLGLSRVALLRGDYETARNKCILARSQHKSNPQPLIMAALIEFYSRHFAEAEKLYEEALTHERAGGVDFAGSVRYLSALGYIKNSSHRPEEGNALLEEARALDEKELLSAPDNSRRLYSLAANYAAAANDVEANRTLDQAISAGWIDYHAMMIDPRFDLIRDTAAFQEKLTRLTLKVQDMRTRQLGRNLTLNLN